MNGTELDFWLGSWHARWEGGEGTNTLTREFGGKVIVERFEGRPSMELTGFSVSVFDADADLWRQTWVDDQGGYFALRGGSEGGDVRSPNDRRPRGCPDRAADGVLRDRSGQLPVALGALDRRRRDVGVGLGDRLHAHRVAALPAAAGRAGGRARDSTVLPGAVVAWCCLESFEAAWRPG